jgi:hypothetical protein
MTNNRKKLLLNAESTRGDIAILHNSLILQEKIEEAKLDLTYSAFEIIAFDLKLSPLEAHRHIFSEINFLFGKLQTRAQKAFERNSKAKVVKAKKRIKSNSFTGVDLLYEVEANSYQYSSTVGLNFTFDMKYRICAIGLNFCKKNTTYKEYIDLESTASLEKDFG